VYFVDAVQRRALLTCTSGLLVLATGCLDPTGLPPQGYRYTSVSTGAEHTCGVAPEQDVYCWGSGAHGQLGEGALRDRPTPVRVRLDEPVEVVSAGGHHTCALARDGRVWCWGDNRSGQAAAGDVDDVSEPSLVSSEPAFITVSAGGEHTCALAQDHTAHCWGRNEYGQLGTGSVADETAPAEVAGAHRFASISAGAHHTCAVSVDGVGYCWGRNDHGQLGTGSVASASAPAAVVGLPSFANISAGALHSCGVGGDGLGYCWGSHAHGELGDGGLIPLGNPGSVEPSVLATFEAGELAGLSAGRHVTCAVSRFRGSLCWGRGREGQLGLGLRVDHSWPQIIIFPDFSGVALASISAGGDTHTCGVEFGYGVYCWGEGARGQLGVGAMVALVPARVQGDRR
jgi:alpha-tubulin suppressor-like RCC1 family protein